MNKNPLLRIGFTLLAFLLFTGAPAQDKGGITLNYTKEPLERVLEDIQLQTRYLFVNSKVDIKQPVSVNIKDKTIEEALKAVFVPINVDYKIEGNNIVIKPGTGAVPPSKKDRTVKGKLVSADGQPVIGGGVQIKGTSIGAVTDMDGNFEIRVPAGKAEGSLVFSCVGFEDVEQPLGDRNTYYVTMKDNLSLQEVVIVGYGSQKKEFVVGSVSQVTSKDILKAPTVNVNGMLTGRLAGFTNIQNSGAPGAGSVMLVRGLSTFGDSQPLCIIDGIQQSYAMLSQLNPNDIASISILKDAATASIYGVHGANGVILVTTKTGTRGSNQITYDGSATFTRNTAMIDLMDAQEYIYWSNKVREMDGLAPYWTEENLQKMKDMGIYAENDPLDQVYKSFGFLQQHNIAASGGNDNFSYYTSLGFTSQDGIIYNTDYKRYNVRGNIDAKLAEGLRFNVNLAGKYSENHEPYLGISPQGEFSPLNMAMYSCPILATEYQGEPLGWYNNVYTFTPNAALNNGGYNDTDSWNFQGSSVLEYSFGNLGFLKGLKLSVFGGTNFTMTANRTFGTPFKQWRFTPQTFQLVRIQFPGTPQAGFTKSTSFAWDLTLRPQIDYDRAFGRHHVTFVGLFERQGTYSDTMTGFKTGYDVVYPIDLNTGLENQAPYVSGEFKKTGEASFAGRLTYMYDEKYMVELTARESGTYLFAPENRWGFFPSVALGWIASKENFLKDTDWVDFLKLRASVGQLGSCDVDPYTYLQSFYSTGNKAAYGIGGKALSAYYAGGYVFRDLTWSRATQYNVGFDATLLKRKLTVGLDVFYNYTSRILEHTGGIYSPSIGGNYPSFDNTGKMDNRGFELTLRHDNWFLSGFSYSLQGMVSWSRNKLLSRKLTDSYPSYQAVLGRPLGEVYGFRFLGLFQTQEEVDNYPTAPSGYTDIGEAMYADINGDGRISREYDFVRIGRSSVPEMTFSLNADLNWMDWSLSMLFQGATLCNYLLSGTYGNGNMDNSIYTRVFYGGQGNGNLALAKNSWTPDHTDAKYPRIHATWNANSAWLSDLYVIDGTYLRLKNLQLTYRLPQLFAKWVGVSRASTYLAGTNLLTFSHYKYLDPENPGINNGYYPQQRTFSLGLNLTF